MENKSAVLCCCVLLHVFSRIKMQQKYMYMAAQKEKDSITLRGKSSLLA